MSSQEASLFEKHPDFKALLQMRQWDDQAKNKDIPVHSNDCYKELCRDILLSKTCQTSSGRSPLFLRHTLQQFRDHKYVVKKSPSILFLCLLAIVKFCSAIGKRLYFRLVEHHRVQKHVVEKQQSHKRRPGSHLQLFQVTSLRLIFL